MNISSYLKGLEGVLGIADDASPWEIVSQLPQLVEQLMTQLGEDFEVSNGIAVHRDARVDATAILKAPAIISSGAYIGAYACLRGGVYIGKNATVGHGAEIKTSMLMDRSAAAHFNFIGDSIIGSDVNFEAGSIVANHFNERQNKVIHVIVEGREVETGVTKFGALVGDGSRIGANAVLSPGTILARQSIVGRLELVDQSRSQIL